jgi:hypothetical protein
MSYQIQEANAGDERLHLYLPLEKMDKCNFCSAPSRKLQLCAGCGEVSLYQIYLTNHINYMIHVSGRMLLCSMSEGSLARP